MLVATQFVGAAGTAARAVRVMTQNASRIGLTENVMKIRRCGFGGGCDTDHRQRRLRVKWEKPAAPPARRYCRVTPTRMKTLPPASRGMDASCVSKVPLVEITLSVKPLGAPGSPGECQDC